MDTIDEPQNVSTTSARLLLAFERSSWFTIRVGHYRARDVRAGCHPFLVEASPR
jgi:hypothetical protein